MARRRPTPPREALTLTGYIRFPEKPGWITPAPDVSKRLWFARDHLDMAKALSWGAVAPFYIDLEAPAPPSGLPKPGPLEVHLKDDHLQYAITWLASAAAVAIAFAILAARAGARRNCGLRAALSLLVRARPRRYGSRLRKSLLLAIFA